MTGEGGRSGRGRRQTPTATSSWSAPQGSRTRSRSALHASPGVPCKAVSRINAPGAYLKSPSEPTTRMPLPSSGRNATGTAAPEPSKGFLLWRSVRSCHAVAVTCHAPESLTRAPQTRPGVTARTTAVVSPGSGSLALAASSPARNACQPEPSRCVTLRAARSLRPATTTSAARRGTCPIRDGDEQFPLGLRVHVQGLRLSPVQMRAL
jgi:hypothetical protein